MNSNKISLTVELLNTIIQYLGTKPYQEVFTMVQQIQEQASQAAKNDPTQTTNNQDEKS